MDKPAGLHFVTGRNLVSPNIGANGIGKSSLFNAVYWCLFGKTLSGLSSTNVTTWQETGCSVSLLLDVGGGTMPKRIVRKRDKSRNTLFCDEAEISQNDVDSLVGLNSELFSRTLMRGQFNRMFFDLSPAEQLRILTDVLDLEIWESASEAAKSKMIGVKRNVEISADASTRAKGEIDANKLSLVKAFEMSKNFIEAERQAVVDLENDLVLKEASVAEFEDKSEPYRAKERSILLDIGRHLACRKKRLSQQLMGLDDDLEKISALKSVNASSVNSLLADKVVADEALAFQISELSGLHNAIKLLQGNFTQWELRVAHFAKFDSSSTCPTCEQAINSNHTDACIKAAEVEMNKIKKKISDIQTAVEAKQQDVTNVQANSDEVNTSILACTESNESLQKKENDFIILKRVAEANEESLLREIDGSVCDVPSEAAIPEKSESDLKIALIDNKKLLDSSEIDLGNLKRAVDVAKLVLESRRSAKNPHTETIKVLQESVASREVAVNSFAEEIAVANRELSQLEFWRDGFRRVRLFVVEQAINTLEIEVNSSLLQLGLSDFVITFATEKEAKSGSIMNKFDVLVTHSSSGNAPVPLSAWSGGEYQRLRIACEIGLSNMILTARGVKCNFEIWDEPTAHLSTEGVESLMHCLRDKAISQRKCVWVIDHIARAFPFDSTTIIEKSIAGSRIVSP